MKILHFIFLIVALTTFSRSAIADPPKPSHDHWRNTRYQGHYVLYDSASHTYIETINCKAAFRFTLVSNELNTLTLFDASRGMTIRLTYEGMYLKPKGAANFSFYQSGTFDTRTQFQHFDASGKYTGAITKRNACTWIEWFPGASSAAFQFVEASTNVNSVELYDRSRDLWVRLDAKAMFLRFSNSTYGFFKNGHW